MNYILLMRQSGEGCDYTIGCGFRWQQFSAENTKDATVLAKGMVRDCGWGDDRATEAMLVAVSELVDLGPLLDAEDAQEKATSDKSAAEREEQAERETFERLRKKFGE